MRKITLFFFLSLFVGMLCAQSPGGVSSPELWFQTKPVGAKLNGSYHWVDFSGDSLRLNVYDSQGAAYGEEYTTQLTRYYIGGQYEIESGVGGNKERLYLNGDAYSASSVYVKEGSSWKLYYICRDYLGSITQLADANGLKYEYSYTAWGRLRNPSTQTIYELDKEPTLFLGRGYTGHEHLPWFGLINMNARLYDPLLMRFLSPDPFVSAPDFSQSFNRYSYALNNPLKYTDPNGEFIIPFLAGLAFGYVANGYHTGDWGWNSVGAGAFVGTGMGAAYTFTGGGNPWVYSSMTMSSMALSNVNWTPSWGDWSLKVNPFVMITRGISASAGGGYYGGAGISLLYENGDNYFSVDLAGGFRNSFSNFEGRASIGGAAKGLSYHYNRYWGGGSQGTGTAGIKSGKFSMRWENDLLAFEGQDKFRSNATEIGWGDYFIGTNVYTTDPDKKSADAIIYGEENNASRLFNNTHGSYAKGHQLSSPLYVGMKTRNGVMRIGHNNPAYGDFFQNGFHHLGTHAIGLKFLPDKKVGSANFQLGDYNSLYYQIAPYWRGMLY